MGLKRFQIRVNNRKILNGFYAMLGLSAKSRATSCAPSTSSTRSDAEKVGEILIDDCGLTRELADEILKFIAIRGTNGEVLSSLARLLRQKRNVRSGSRASSRRSRKYLAAFGVPEENFAVDLTIARGLDYYTGTVYETTLLDHPEIGSGLLRRQI